MHTLLALHSAVSPLALSYLCPSQLNHIAGLGKIKSKQRKCGEGISNAPMDHPQSGQAKIREGFNTINANKLLEYGAPIL